MAKRSDVEELVGHLAEAGKRYRADGQDEHWFLGAITDLEALCRAHGIMEGEWVAREAEFRRRKFAAQPEQERRRYDRAIAGAIAARMWSLGESANQAIEYFAENPDWKFGRERPLSRSRLFEIWQAADAPELLEFMAQRVEAETGQPPEGDAKRSFSRLFDSRTRARRA